MLLLPQLRLNQHQCLKCLKPQRQLRLFQSLVALRQSRQSKCSQRNSQRDNEYAGGKVAFFRISHD